MVCTIELNPNSATGHMNLGVALSRTGKGDDAIACYRKALELNAHDSNTHNNLGAALADAGMLDEAIACYRKAIELNPQNSRAHNNLGIRLSRQGRPHGAVECYDAAIGANPAEWSNWYLRGKAHLDLGQLEQAAADFSQVLELQPDQVDAWHLRGIAQLRLQQWDQATSGLAQPFTTPPETPAAWQFRGRHSIRLGLWAEAAAEYAQAESRLEMAPMNEFYFHALLQFSAGDVERYQRLCQRALERCGDVPGAEQAYQAAMANLISPDPPADPARLVQLAEQAVGDQKLSWRVGCLGMAYYRAGRYDEAIAALRKAVTLEPNFDPIWLDSYLAMAHHRLGQADAARAALDEATRATDQRFEAALNLDVGLLPTNWWNFLQAQLHYREARRMIEGTEPPDDARPWILRGRALEVVGRGVEAQSAYQTARGLQPDDLAIELRCLPILCRTDAFAEALDGLRTFLQDHPAQAAEDRLTLASLHLLLGQRLWGLDRRQDAERAFVAAAEISPNDPQLLQARGSVWFTLAEDDRAVADVSQALELMPDSESRSVLHHLRGAAHLRRGRFTEARADLEQRLELARENAEAHNDLAWLLATCPELTVRDTGRALHLAQRAVELAPQNGGYWNTLGVTQYRVADWPGAIQSLSRSEELAPDQFFSFNSFFVAMAHWQRGDTDAARQCYDQAVTWMDQHNADDAELQRFRAEAAELLGAREQPGK